MFGGLSKMGKGSWPRPNQTTWEERDLRYKYATGQITLADFQCRYDNLKRKGLIRRGGRVVK